MKKLTTTEAKDLMTNHIFELSKEQLDALGFILDVEISHFKKSDWNISFKMTHKQSTVIVECSKGSFCSIGRRRAGRDGMSGLTGWGGCRSFARAILVFRRFFLRGYELTFQSPEKLGVYSKDEWSEILLMANEVVEAA